MALRVYKCNECGKTLISKAAAENDCLKGWTELVAGSVDAAVEKHVPVLVREGNLLKVDVGSVAHPMTAEHLIEWVAVETNEGYKVEYLDAGKAPVAVFVINDGETVEGVYAYCNLHGLWKA